jgi:indole-3-glycerol phosphate synthase
MSAGRLEPILASVRARAAERRRARSVADLRKETRADPSRRARFVGALRGRGLSFVTEIKRRSPSAGQIATGVDVLARACSYASGGAAALSVLTEEDHFAGSPHDLERVSAAGLPRLRKDFLLDEGMVLESVAMGADAVLLLAVCLEDPLLGEMRALAGELGLAVLLEVHDEHELERALAVAPDCIGVNARDLTSFRVDLATSERLLPGIPARHVRVAESGLATSADLLRVRRAGADAALIGEALMRTDDPAALLRSWREALDA